MDTETSLALVSSLVIGDRDGSGPFFWPRVGFRVLRSSLGGVSG